MTEIKWIKITTSMFDDEKIDYIESLPEADSIIVIWIKLLALAGKCNAGGYIFLTETIPYNDEMLSHKFKRPLNTVKFALATFAELKMIILVDGFIVVRNWEKHQNVEALEKIRESNKLRQKRFRESLKLLPSGDATVTLRNDLDLDLELDLEKDKNNNNVTENERTILGELKNVKQYPFDYEKDLAFVRSITVDYPDIDVLHQIKRWATYKLDKPLEKKSNPRSQIRTWMEKSQKWAEPKNKGTKNPESDQIEKLIRQGQSYD